MIKRIKPRSTNSIDQHIGSRSIRRRRKRMVQIAAALLKADIDFFYPAKANGHKPVASTMDGFLASREGLVIAEAFVRIKDPQVRHVIASSIARLAGALDCA